MNLERRKQLLDSIQKKYKKKKYFVFLMALFTLSVNAFAWFAFTTQAGVEIKGEVAAWDIEFLDENQTEVHDAIVVVSNMKPGMADFEKTYIINNQSDVPAELTYEILSLSILGRTVDLTTISDKVTYLHTNYPFSVQFEQEKVTIPSKSSSNFKVQVTWPFESAIPIYFKLNNIYDYDEYFTYYTKIENTYQETQISDLTYPSNRDSLYLDKDDADTYFGMECKTYETTTGYPCLDINLRLHVDQINS